MLDGATQEHHGSQVAFSVLRVLTIGYCLWGVQCDVSLAELPRLVRATNTDVARAIVGLLDLSLVMLDRRRHTIRLTQQAFHQLLAARPMVC